jgi:hypothetical protein
MMATSSRSRTQTNSEYPDSLDYPPARPEHSFCRAKPRDLKAT